MEPCSLRDGSHQPQGLSRGIGKNYHLLDTGGKPAKSFMEKRDIGNMIQIGMLQVIPMRTCIPARPGRTGAVNLRNRKRDSSSNPVKYRSL